MAKRLHCQGTIEGKKAIFRAQLKALTLDIYCLLLIRERASLIDSEGKQIRSRVIKQNIPTSDRELYLPALHVSKPA